MSAAYFRAAIPEPYQILGVKLRPFSLGHFIHMARHDVAFVSEKPAVAELSDLILGIQICSVTYEGFMEWIYSANVAEEMKEWGRKAKDFDFDEKVKLFREYIAEGSKQPPIFFEEEPKQSGAHWTQSLKVGLQGMGCSETEALNSPLSKAFEDYFKHAENMGAVRIANEFERSQIEALEKADAGKEESCQKQG